MTLPSPTAVAPYLRCLKVNNVRTFAAAAAAQPKKESSKSSSAIVTPREELKTTVVGNVVVSSIETHQGLSKLAVYFKAGSRYEKKPGTAHALRVFSGLGTSGATQFGLSRNIDFLGGNMYCNSGREYIGYTLEATRDKIDSLEKFLRDATVHQEFKPWELDDHLPRLKLDRVNRPPEVRLLERLHKAAFRRGLGNSLYSPKFMVGNHTTDLLKEHVNSNFIEASVVALGMPHDTVVAFANQLKLKQAGGRNVEASKFYYGSEIRKASGSDLAYVALAVEGAPLSKPKEMITAALVHRALGAGPRTKRGMNPGGKLDAVTRNTPKESLATSLSASYTDSGIVGAFLVASSCCIEQVTKKAAEVIRTVSFSDDDVNRAKNILKADIGCVLDTDAGLLEDMGLQSLLTKQVVSSGQLFTLIDTVTAADVNSILKKSGGKLVMAAYGDISNVPYLDELK